MQYDPKTYLHGDPIHGDMREKLADILNVDGYDRENAFGGKLRKPYWDNFIDDMFSGAGSAGELDYLFQQAIFRYT
jgi:hypothetical protein